MNDTLEAHIDRTVAPCDDFYRFATGGWVKQAIIPPDEAAWGSFYEVRDRNEAVLHEICEDAAAGRIPGEVARKVGDLYASGMDEAAIDRAGTAPIADDLRRIDAVADTAELPRLLGQLHQYRIGGAFGFAVLPDAKQSGVYLAQLVQGGLGLPDRDYYLRDDEKSRTLREAYVAHVRRTFELLGGSDADPAAQADLVLRLETRLAGASMTRVDQRAPYKTYNKRAVAALAGVARGFDWSEYFGALGAPRFAEINVRQPDFFAELARMCADVSVAEWRVYLRWHVARVVSPYLGPALEREGFDFYDRVLQGKQEMRPRWKRVVDVVDQEIGEALGQLYVERAFPPEAKRRVLEMVEHLRAVLAERIEALAWMSDVTKERAIAKLAKFGVKMGYPDRWRDYSALRIDRGSYAGNVLRATRFEFERQLRRVGGPVDRTEWRMTPPTVNAYYYPPGNEIVFPAGILQPPFFDFEADDAVNFGAIGVVIGHEMTHGFDDQGSKYDAEGNLREWWTPDDRAGYESRTDLVVRQYDGYEPLPGLHLNGKLTLGENIADLGGVKVAFDALQRSLRSRPQPELGGFTPAQRFFLGLAQVWRSKQREELTRLRAYVDPHSTPQFRVNGPLSNFEPFHEAFGCPSGGAMWRPPELRPSIW